MPRHVLPPGYASAAELAVLIDQANLVVDVGADFPQLALRHSHGSVRWTDSDYRGWEDLRDFALLHEDAVVSVLVVGAVRERRGFTVDAEVTTDAFETLFSADGGAQYAGSLAMFGPSGRWAVFGEPDLGVWWSDLPEDDPELSAWELRYRPWAYSAAGAADLWGLAFRRGMPKGLSDALHANYGRFDREDREADMPEVPITTRWVRGED